MIVPNEIVAGRIALSLLACSPLTGCSSPLPPGPNGHVSLRFERLNSDGFNVKDIYFILENRSQRSIHFRGTKTLWPALTRSIQPLTVIHRLAVMAEHSCQIFPSWILAAIRRPLSHCRLGIGCGSI